MKARDVLDLATRNLRESKLRNGLTTVGIAVGIASLVAMLSLGIGLQQLFNRRLAHSGLFDTVLVSLPRDMRAFGAQRPEAPARAMDESARAAIARLPHVAEVYPEVRFVTEVRYVPAGSAAAESSAAQKPLAAMVAGLTSSASQNESFENMQGKFFSSPAAQEAILLDDFAKEVLGQASQDGAPVTKLLGQEIELRYAERQPLDQPSGTTAEGAGNPDSWGFSVVRRARKLRVVGIIDREPYGGFRGMGRGGVFLPIEVAENLNVMQPGDLRGIAGASATGRTYLTLMVRVARPVDVELVQQSIHQMGFATFSLLDATRNLRRFFAVLDLFLGIFGSLALAVAALGIVNTLVMAILERRREIGIMKAIGASDGDVKRLFFAEAAAMGVAGGLGGVALGWAIGRVINVGTNVYLRRQQLPAENLWAVPWWLVAGAVAFSIIVTLVAGLYPAARAARLDPVQALRYE